MLAMFSRASRCRTTKRAFGNIAEKNAIRSAFRGVFSSKRTRRGRSPAGSSTYMRSSRSTPNGSRAAAILGYPR
jgi:hypothetical protein